MSFILKDLPYAKNALEPHISERVVDLHYDKHHRGYVTKLNQVVAGTPDEKRTLDCIVAGGPEKVTKGAYNPAAQAWNHTFYWDGLCAAKDAKPAPAAGKLHDAIVRDFGSFEAFQKTFSDKAAGHFASGWVWLCTDKDGKLSIWEGHDAANPLTVGLRPLLTIDVWEHAYYLDYQNRRPDYIKAWWNVVNWDAVEKRYE